VSAGALPNLIVIGAQKCATTSLHRYLSFHPSINMSRQKELNFFTTLPVQQSVEWYRSWFDPAAPVRGDTSPSYTNMPADPGVPSRMHALVPDARLIYLVRDPVERALTSYRHRFASRHESRPVEEALSDPREQYIQRSLYHYQLEQFLPFYDISRILVIQQEALLNDRDRTLAAIFAWIGVEPFRSWRFRMQYHRSARKRRLTEQGVRFSQSALMKAVGGLPDPFSWMIRDTLYLPVSNAVAKPVIDSATRERLRGEFRSDVAQLRRLTGLQFEGWSV
jgi:hypothetical protein